VLAPAQLLADLTDLLALLRLLRDCFYWMNWLGRGWLGFKLGAEVEDQFRWLILLASPNEEITIIEIVCRVTECLGGIRIELQDTTIKRIFLSVTNRRCLLEVV
jgi:hypothetical protein